MKPAKAFGAAVSAALALCLLFSPPLAQAQAPRERPAANTEEGGLWDLSDRAEREARRSGELNQDPALNAYLRDIACRVAAQQCGDIRLYVMNRPFFNASMAPNGYMEIWSGLLLRAQNEAEAAFVIGHEISHFSDRHSLAMQQVIQSRANTALVLGVAVAAVGAAAAANSPNSAQSILDATGGVSNIVYLGTLASIFGFSREMETEADQGGFNRAVAAGYDAAAGVTLWQGLLAETAASDHERVRRRATRASIFATHPVGADRVEALQALASVSDQSGEAHRGRYRAAIRPHLIAWLRDDLRRRDFGQTLHLIDRLGQHGEDLGALAYMRGETFRLRRGEGDLPRARAAYEEAITHADAPAEAWRDLGAARLRERDTAGARAAWETYLQRAPDAEDRALVALDLAGLPAAPVSEAAP